MNCSKFSSLGFCKYAAFRSFMWTRSFLMLASSLRTSRKLSTITSISWSIDANRSRIRFWFSFFFCAWYISRASFTSEDATLRSFKRASTVESIFLLIIVLFFVFIKKFVPISSIALHNSYEFDEKDWSELTIYQILTNQMFPSVHV